MSSIRPTAQGSPWSLGGELMTPAQFYSACVALWGEHWARNACNRFKVGDRTIRAWAQGRDPIPAGVVGEIRAAALEKIQRLTELTQ